jgi:hypothetical protein
MGLCPTPTPKNKKEEREWEDVGFIWCFILRIVHPQKGNTKGRTVVESRDNRLYTQMGAAK